MKLGQPVDIGMSNIFKKHFACFEKVGPKPRFFLIHQSAVINHKALMVSLRFFSVPKMYTEMIENSKHHLIKTRISYHTAILSKP